MKIEIELKSDWDKDGMRAVIKAAANTIQEVMMAGHAQRLSAGKPTDSWKGIPSVNRFNHAFVHLCNAKTHPDPCAALTKDTALTEASHALCGLAMVACIEGGYLETGEGLVIDATEDQVKGE